MTVYTDDVKRLGSPLSEVATGLLEYAKSFVPGSEFERKKTMWVLRPNFVAFRVPVRTKEVIFSVYRFASGYKKSPKLPIHWSGRSSYSEFRLDDPRQLGAAASYIATAYHYSRFKRRKSTPAELHELL